MTIEITILPISCRTLHKIMKFLRSLFLNVFMFVALIVGGVCLLYPRYGDTIPQSEGSVLLTQILGVMCILAGIILITIIYDIKISWCIKEKSE